MIVQLLMPVLIGTVFNQGEAAQIFAQRRFRREERSASHAGARQRGGWRILVGLMDMP